MDSTISQKGFTRYEMFVVAILAILQFTVVLDFMVLSPLSAILLEELSITTSQFGLVVSAYAFSAGASGLLAAGFADKFDRKRILLFFYTGFILGTLFCGLAPNYELLLAARIITGIFGGVISSISFAIVTDLFSLEKRGRVMGFVQMAFATSQVLGIPFGIWLANQWGWHSPFLLIVALSVIVFGFVAVRLKPIDAHLSLQTRQNAFVHLWKTASNRRYMTGFSVTVFLATGGFMLMPFGAAFVVNNLGIAIDKLPLVYLITGLFSMAAGPLAGKLSDSIGKYRVFWVGSAIAALVILFYCSLGTSPFWLVVLLNVIMMMAITSRMTASQALITAVPEARDRGAFMGINSSVMQISGGIASAIAGLIIVQDGTGNLINYDILGMVVTGTIGLTIGLMFFVNKMIFTKERAEMNAVTKAAA